MTELDNILMKLIENRELIITYALKLNPDTYPYIPTTHKLQRHNKELKITKVIFINIIML